MSTCSQVYAVDIYKYQTRRLIVFRLFSQLSTKLINDRLFDGYSYNLLDIIIRRISAPAVAAPSRQCTTSTRAWTRYSSRKWPPTAWAAGTWRRRWTDARVRPTITSSCSATIRRWSIRPTWMWVALVGCGQLCRVTLTDPFRLQIDDEGTLWMMTNTMPVFIYSRLDPDAYNFRVWKAKTADLVRGTACEP